MPVSSSPMMARAPPRRRRDWASIQSKFCANSASSRRHKIGHHKHGWPCGLHSPLRRPNCRQSYEQDEPQSVLRREISLTTNAPPPPKTFVPPTNGLHEFDADIVEGFDDAHAMFKDLRGRCPVAHSADFEGFWVLTKYDDVIRTLADYENFSTAYQNVVPRVATSGRRPPLHLDPPEHT